MLIISGIFAALAIKRRQFRFAVEVAARCTHSVGRSPVDSIRCDDERACSSVLCGRDAIWDLAAVVVGGILGSLTLAAFFMGHGVLGDFLSACTIQSGTRLSIAQRLGRALGAPLVDPSAVLLLVALAVVATAAIFRSEGRRRSAAIVGVLLGAALPCAMGFGRKIYSLSTPGWRSSQWPPRLHQLSKPRAGRFEFEGRPRCHRSRYIACGSGVLPAWLVVVWLEWDLRGYQQSPRSS